MDNPAVDSPSRITDAAALLIAALCGYTFRVPKDTDWQALLDLAQRHGVLSLVFRALQENSVETPATFARAIGEHTASTTRLARELE
jgi:hypothetical protein